MDSWNPSGVTAERITTSGRFSATVDEIGERGVGAEVDDSPSVAVQDDAEGQQSGVLGGVAAEGRWA